MKLGKRKDLTAKIKEKIQQLFICNYLRTGIGGKMLIKTFYSYVLAHYCVLNIIITCLKSIQTKQWVFWAYTSKLPAGSLVEQTFGTSLIAEAAINSSTSVPLRTATQHGQNSP